MDPEKLKGGGPGKFCDNLPRNSTNFTHFKRNSSKFWKFGSKGGGGFLTPWSPHGSVRTGAYRGFSEEGCALQRKHTYTYFIKHTHTLTCTRVRVCAVFFL